jgi:hypothetical protein
VAGLRRSASRHLPSEGHRRIAWENPIAGARLCSKTSCRSASGMIAPLKQPFTGYQTHMEVANSVVTVLPITAAPAARAQATGAASALAW